MVRECQSGTARELPLAQRMRCAVAYIMCLMPSIYASKYIGEDFTEHRRASRGNQVPSQLLPMYSYSCSLFGLNCIWLAVDFSFYLCAALSLLLLLLCTRTPSPPLSHFSDCSAMYFFFFFTFLYFSVCQLLATKLNTCLCVVFFSLWQQWEVGGP